MVSTIHPPFAILSTIHYTFRRAQVLGLSNKTLLRGGSMRTIHRSIPLRVSLLCCLLSSFSIAVSQSPISIIVTHSVAPVNQLSVNDIDFRHSTTPKWLFTININVIGVDTLWVKMTVNAGFVLPNGEAHRMAVNFRTEHFRVIGTKTVSNLDLGADWQNRF